MTSVAFDFGVDMAKEAAKSLARSRLAKQRMQADMAEAAKSGIDPRFAPAPVAPAAPVAGAAAAEEGLLPRARRFLFGAGAGAGKTLGRAGKLGLLAAGGLGALGLWNTARTGSPFKHDTGGGSAFGSSARNLSRTDPLAQFGGMEPGAANYWDQITMAALQREAQSQNALDRIRMLRRMGPSA